MAAASTQQLPITLPQRIPLQLHSPYPAYSSQSTITPPHSDSSSPQQAPSPRSPLNGLPSHIQLQSKQLRTPRSPMYVPAVLRPTEKPVRHSPPKRAGETAVDLDEGTPAEGETSSVRRIVTEEWNETGMGDVTGPPSRNHWKPDSSSPTCDSPTCYKPFTFFSRRHHCRRCGSIFCAAHSVHQVPLDQHARFHPLAPTFRACDDCFRDFRVWDAQRRAKASVADGKADGPDTPELLRTGSADGALGVKGKGVEIQGAQQKKGGLISSIAQSMPRDWSWSTF